MQCITLFKDIERIALDKNRNSHFLGTIVYVEGDSTANFRNEFECSYRLKPLR